MDLNTDKLEDLGVESIESASDEQSSGTTSMTYIVAIIMIIVGVVIFIWILTYFLSEEDITTILNEMHNNNSNLQPVADQ